MRLRNTPIPKRLKYSFFLLSLLPIIIIGTFASHITSKAIITKSNNYSTQIVNILKDNIGNQLNKYENLADEIILNPILQAGLETFDGMKVTEQNKFKDNINNVLTKKFATYPYLRDLKIINKDNQQIYQRGYLVIEDKILQEILSRMKGHGSTLNCFGIKIYDKRYVILSKTIHSIYNREKVGELVLILDENVVRDTYKNINLGDGASITLLDYSNGVMSCSQDESNLSKYEELVVQATLKKYDIEILGGIPYTYLKQDVRKIQFNVIGIMAVCLLLSLIVSKMISRSITQPLNALVDYVSEAVEQKFDTDFVDESNDELGLVVRAFKTISNKMRNMIKQIEVEQKERTKLEISMLQAQINPHFLFNTLNSLRWISMMSGATSVSEGILALSNLLGNTIIDKAEYITIQEEIENVNNYILIQKLRYGDCFEVIYDIPENLKDCKTLKFILQPIVENAILHAGCNEQNTVKIYIRLTEDEEDKLVFSVLDDGKGFDINEIDQARTIDKMSGIGIHNVQDRLQLNFGKLYGLSIHSKLEEGTCVMLYIPKMDSDRNV
ncbi:MAG: sensor histidine kinase [Cellulosilyticaceae bacterium]